MPAPLNKDTPVMPSSCDDGAGSTTVHASQMLAYYVQLSQIDAAVMSHGLEVLSLRTLLNDIEAMIEQETPEVYANFMVASALSSEAVSHARGEHSELCHQCHTHVPEWPFRM